MKSRTKCILWLTPLTLVVAYAVAYIGIRSEPSGYVASYSLLPHDKFDVIEFANGLVTQRTCCGDMPMGTYSRAPDGNWIWHYPNGGKNPTTNDIVVRSGYLSMSFADTKDARLRFTLWRRVFRWIPL